MITERLRKDASFMRVLTRAGGWHKAYLIDEMELQKISATMIEAAERIEALERELEARAASPKVPQAKAEPTVRQLHMIDRGHRKGFCDVDDETGTLFSNVPAKWAQELIETFCDADRYRSLPQQVTALPQGVEEWIDMHSVGAVLFDQDVLCVAECDLRAYLSGMAIVPVERLKYLNDHHHATESGVGLARLALSRGDTQRAIEALDSTSEKLDSILDVLAAAKEPATCSVCGLKRSDTKNCKAPDCSPMLAAAKEKGDV